MTAVETAISKASFDVDVAIDIESHLQRLEAERKLQSKLDVLKRRIEQISIKTCKWMNGVLHLSKK